MTARQRRRPATTQGGPPDAARLLIVEPDELVLGLIERWLTEAGYPLASDDAPPDEVSLVIADVPRPAQADAALRSVRDRYDAPILAISARFGREALASKGTAIRLGVARTLPKPFTREELLAAVAACLEGS